MKQKINILVLSLLISSLGTIFHIDAAQQTPQQVAIAATFAKELVGGFAQGIGQGIAKPISDRFDATLDTWCPWLTTEELKKKKQLQKEIEEFEHIVAQYKAEDAKIKLSTLQETEDLTKRHNIANTELAEIQIKAQEAQLEKAKLELKSLSLNNESSELQIDNAHLSQSTTVYGDIIKKINALNDHKPNMIASIKIRVKDPVKQQELIDNLEKKHSQLVQQMFTSSELDDTETNLFLLKTKLRLAQDAQKLGVTLDNQGFLIEKPA